MAICRAFSIRWMPVVAALTMLASMATSSSLLRAQQAPPPGVVTSAKAKKAHAKAPVQKAAPATGTRFVVALDEPIDLNAVEILALKRPNRLLIDLPQVGVSLPDQPPPDAPAGVVKSFQHLSPAPGKLRIVIDVTGPVVFEKAIEKAPDGKSDWLVVSIVAASEVTAAADAPDAPVVTPPAPKRAVPPKKRASGPKPVIVIDPGHGGHDSGARKYGTVEKDVVLSFSLKLREKLEETGFYKVLMTRDTDVFIPLDERRKFGERHQAALFIAIHADYTQRASARGATIYSLRPEVADTLKRVAGDVSGETGGKKVAGADTAELGAVKGILAEKARDLIDRNHLRTSIFARSVIAYVGTSTNLMDNPDRNAGFAVLRTAKVPAILLELGYVTNEADAAQLKSDEWRDRVAGAMVTAINAYVSECLLMTRC
jgi:N-acetylmuramoyl-L-alanine amidase